MFQENSPAVTIIVPTKNRSDFVERLVKYYESVRYPYSLIIADSSEPGHFEKTGKLIATLKNKLELVHLNCVGLNVQRAVFHSEPSVNTPYFAIVADDDFLIPNAVQKAASFLENHPEYSAANGKALLIGVGGDHTFGPVSLCSPYLLCTVEQETAAQRLRDYFLPSPRLVVFSVQRTANLKKVWFPFEGDKQGGIFDELVPSSILVMLGKVKTIDHLYLVREGHPRQYTQVRLYPWLTSPQWQPSLTFLKQQCVSMLVMLDHISKAEAESVFDEIFSEYLLGAFVSIHRKSRVSRRDNLQQRVLLWLRQKKWYVRVRLNGIYQKSLFSPNCHDFRAVVQSIEQLRE